MPESLLPAIAGTSWICTNLGTEPLGDSHRRCAADLAHDTFVIIAHPLCVVVILPQESADVTKTCSSANVRLLARFFLD